MARIAKRWVLCDGTAGQQHRRILDRHADEKRNRGQNAPLLPCRIIKHAIELHARHHDRMEPVTSPAAESQPPRVLAESSRGKKGEEGRGEGDGLYTHPSCTFRIYVSVAIRFCTVSLKHSTVAPGLLPAPAPAPACGMNRLATSACKLCASHSRAAVAAAPGAGPVGTTPGCC
jgi:hypothetical protein